MGTSSGWSESGGGGGGEIWDNYSTTAHPLETLIGLSMSPGTILDNATNESTLGSPANDDLFPDYPRQLTQLTAGVCVIFFMVGIPGNLITIVALLTNLARCKKVRRFMTIIC
jgi:hypothetical protein